ncbi:MAG: hypothetical protein GXP45_03675 [bacterium]|nr:hypothetical protein [bacterium]
MSTLWQKGESFSQQDVKDQLSAYFANKSPEQGDLDKKKKQYDILQKEIKKLSKKKNKTKEEKEELIKDQKALSKLDAQLLMAENQVMIAEIQSEVSAELADLIANSSKWETLSVGQKKSFVKQYLAAYMQ